MLKKFAVIALMLVSFSVFADDKNKDEIKLEGEVVAINAAAQTFDVKDANNMVNTFKVTTATDFDTKCDTCMIMKENIMPIHFDALKTGDWVAVKFKGNTVEKIADDVKIYRK